jgi:hypothetical protein
MTAKVEPLGPAAMQDPVDIFKPTDQTSPTSAPPPPHTYDDHSSQSSLASQRSAPVPVKGSEDHVSPVTISGPVPEDLTPPSSTASPVHEHEHKTQAGNPNGMVVEPATTSSFQPIRQSRSPSTSGSLSEGTNGVKRTASGQVKISQPTDAGHPTTDARHVRASSSLSAASTSNVTEVCPAQLSISAPKLSTVQIGQQLRTRLKYAMVKVQHGWQTRSLDELESIASASPRSHASPFNQTRSPYSKMTRKWSDSSSSESSLTGPRSTLPSTLPTTTTTKPNGYRSLAPPADIIPGSRRRPTPNEAAWHAISTHSQPLLSSKTRPSSQRTPSQNAAMEADAVETLLFMASPSNSGYHPNSQSQSQSQPSQESHLRSTLTSWSAQTSPLRTQFSQTSMTSPKKVAFEDQGLRLQERKEEAIERMIDDVVESDESAEREMEEVLRAVGKRKVVS